MEINPKFATYLVETIIPRLRLGTESELDKFGEKIINDLFEGASISPGFGNLKNPERLVVIETFLRQLIEKANEVKLETLPDYTQKSLDLMTNYTDLSSQVDTGGILNTSGEYASGVEALNTGLENIQSQSEAPLAPLSQQIGQVVVGQGISRLAGAAAGAATGGLSLAASAIAPTVISWAKRNAQYLLTGIGGLIGFLSFGGVGAVVGGGGGWLLAGGLAGGGAGFSGAASGLASGISAFFVGLGAAALGAVAVPLAIGLIATPVAVALILFIISSGAYITPPLPSQLTGAGESSFIQVTKTANPEGPFENENLPLTIEYNVQISATLGSLSNIKVEDECEAIKKGGTTPCPNVEIDLSELPESISPLEPFSFSYKAVYSENFENSVVINKINVTADTPGKSGERSTGSTSITIGEPPTECFAFSGNWPEPALSSEFQAIAIMSQAEVFMAKLCSQGEITLIYAPQATFQGLQYGGEIVGVRRINIYPAGTGSVGNTLYTLAHESGHILAQVTSHYREYLDAQNIASEGSICTYPFQPAPPSENFAEMVALYIAGPNPVSGYRNLSCLGGTFRQSLPRHWNFARDVIFQEVLGW